MDDKHRLGQHRAERDVDAEEVEARARDHSAPTGSGASDASAADSNSTTGTTPAGEYVGRVAGADDAGAGEVTGAERRSADDRG